MLLTVPPRSEKRSNYKEVYMSRVKDYIIDYIQREYDLPKDIDTDSFNYMENGYIDSMGLIQFVVLLEDEFSITFDDEELSLPEFKTIGGLEKIITEKMEAGQ